jgi:hypothetical protein
MNERVQQEPPAEVIDRDIPCRRCGYDLRMLRADARCPECGGSIAESIELFNSRELLLEQANARWVRKIALGTFLLFLTAVASHFAYFPVEWDGPLPSGYYAIFGLAPLLAAMSVSALTTYEPGVAQRPRQRWLRQSLRWFAVLATVGPYWLAISGLLRDRLPNYVYQIMGWVSPWSFLAVLPATVLLYVQLGRYARRLAQHRVVYQARLLAVLPVITMLAYLGLRIRSLEDLAGRWILTITFTLPVTGISVPSGTTLLIQELFMTFLLGDEDSLLGQEFPWHWGWLFLISFAVIPVWVASFAAGMTLSRNAN